MTPEVKKEQQQCFQIEDVKALLEKLKNQGHVNMKTGISYSGKINENDFKKLDGNDSEMSEAEKRLYEKLEDTESIIKFLEGLVNSLEKRGNKLENKNIEDMSISEARKSLQILNDKYKNNDFEGFSLYDSLEKKISDINNRDEARLFQEALIDKIGGQGTFKKGFLKNEIISFSKSKGNYLQNVDDFEKVLKSGEDIKHSKQLSTYILKIIDGKNEEETRKAIQYKIIDVIGLDRLNNIIKNSGEDEHKERVLDRLIDLNIIKNDSIFPNLIEKALDTAVHLKNSVSEFGRNYNAIKQKAEGYEHHLDVKNILDKADELNNSESQEWSKLNSLRKEMGRTIRDIIVNESKISYQNALKELPEEKIKPIFDDFEKYAKKIENGKSISGSGSISNTEIENLKKKSKIIKSFESIAKEIKKLYESTGLIGEELEKIRLEGKKLYKINENGVIDLKDFKDFIEKKMNNKFEYRTIEELEKNGELEKALKETYKKYNLEEKDGSGTKLLNTVLGNNEDSLSGLSNNEEIRVFQDKLIKRILEKDGGSFVEEENKPGKYGYSENYVYLPFGDNRTGNTLLTHEEYIKQEIKGKPAKEWNSWGVAGYFSSIPNKNLNINFLIEIIGVEKLKQLQKIWENVKESEGTGIAKKILANDSRTRWIVEGLKEADLSSMIQDTKILNNSCKIIGEKGIDIISNQIYKGEEVSEILSEIPIHKTNEQSKIIVERSKLQEFGKEFEKKIPEEEMKAFLDIFSNLPLSEGLSPDQSKSLYLEISEAVKNNTSEINTIKHLKEIFKGNDKTTELGKLIRVIYNKEICNIAEQVENINKEISRINEKRKNNKALTDREQKLIKELPNLIDILTTKRQNLESLNFTLSKINLDNINDISTEDYETEINEIKGSNGYNNLLNSQASENRLLSESKEAQEEILNPNASDEELKKAEEAIEKNTKHIEITASNANASKNASVIRLSNTLPKGTTLNNETEKFLKRTTNELIEFIETQDINTKTQEDIASIMIGRDNDKELIQAIESSSYYDEIIEMRNNQKKRENKFQKEKSKTTNTRTTNTRNTNTRTTNTRTTNTRQESYTNNYDYNPKSGTFTIQTPNNTKKTLTVKPGEKEKLKNNESRENYVSFYETLEKVGLAGLWEYRDEISNAIGNINGSLNFNQDFLDPNEQKIFLNAILKSVGRAPISQNKTLEEFRNIFSQQRNNIQALGGFKNKSSKKGNSEIEEEFLIKFILNKPTFQIGEFKKSIK